VERGGIGQLTWRASRLFPDNVAVEYGDVTLTYTQIEERADRLAGALAGLGIGSGDTVLLLYPNDYRFVECFLGVPRTGAVIVLGNIKLGAETLAYVADHCEASVLISHADLADKVELVRRAAPGLKHVIVAGGGVADANDYDELVGAAEPITVAAEVDPDALGMLMYTSGSSGRPKGVMLSHTNTIWQARSSARTMILDDEDKALIFGPLYHANALWSGMLPMLYVGGGLAVLDGFDPPAALAAIERYRPTFTSGTPSMFTLLLNEYERSPRDVSSLELLMCGSAPVPDELMTALKRRFGAEVVEGYGLTEGGATLETPRWGIKKLGSTGLPVPDADIRVAALDDPARDCDVEEVGELWTRSPANALGYLKQPEVTAERFMPDGFLLTGDLVKRDADGYVYIAGRKDDLINIGGENAYPKEIETILLQHPAVDDVAVVPIPHAVKGSAPVAWVVLRNPGSADEDELKQFFLERGPAYAHPRRVFFLDALPVSGTNKIDRMFLTEEAARRLPEGIAGGAAR
jgi:acyl-CoA synthetase (AMP-forming)/AMP-acid ligase II